MNVAVATSLAAALLAIAAGLLARRISRAPGSWDQRPFAVVAFSAAVYALCSLASLLGTPDAAALWFARAKLSAVYVHLWAWIRYSQAMLERRPTLAERALAAALLAGAIVPLVPGLVFEEPVLVRAYAPLGVVYRQGVPTAAGATLVVGLVVAALFPLARFVGAWRAGVAHTGVIAAAFCALVLAGANDALATLGLDLPYLLEAAFVAPVLAVAWVVTTRFVDGARALAELRAQLLRDVEARTRELAAAFDALHQSERLAALGRFASGLAHEVNSPAAVVTANLRYLQECLRGGALPADGHEAVGDALASMQQINALVRKLLDAGRVASAPGAAASVSVAALAQEAVADARRRLAAGGVALIEVVPERLAGVAPREVLVQVLATLVANAAESIPEGRRGRIALRAERVAGLVRIAVSDDGAGMPPEVLRRAFDPFFTTKRAGGRGAGLGLAVARALVEGHGGTLWLESSPGKGTTAHLELPEDAPEPAPSATPPPAAPGAREV
jgi:signal transduction histidine kinase